VADRREPGIPPLFGNAGQGAGGIRRGGVAPNLILGGTSYGLVTPSTSAVGRLVRNDSLQLSRNPVAVTRPIWERLNLIGVRNAEVPSRPVPATDSPTHGSGCLDCARG
jgi:hypothetical protein